MGAKRGFSSGILDLSAMVPKLPQVKFPTGSVVQLRSLTAASYERFRTLQDMYNDHISGGAEGGANIAELWDLVDEVLRMVVPDATDDDLASLGMRLDARTSLIFAAAGEMDAVLAMLQEEESEGKATEG